MGFEISPALECLEAEVVVIGGGTAGIPAALAAIEKGAKKVILIEKRISLGGNGLRAMGIFGAESPLQKRANAVAPRDALFRKAMKWHQWDRVDPRIIRSFIDKSGDTIQWLENIGVEFETGTPSSFHPTQMPTWHVPKGRIAGVIKTLTERCREKGVQILLRATCNKILRGSKDNINGVLVTWGGKEIEIKANSIIITTGGFAGNKELLKKYFPWLKDTIHNRGVPNTGDGMIMAEEAGAHIEEFATMIKEGPVVPGLNLFSNLSRLVREPFTVWVNKKGKRFVDESACLNIFESVNSMLLQPDMLSYAILDDGLRKLIEEKWKNLNRPKLSQKKGHGLQEDLRIQSSERHKRVKISDSWEEIANWMGVDYEILRDTVARYNSFCERGRDEIFAKNKEYLKPLCNAPYYAIITVPNMLDTIGAIKINEKMEVLNRNGEPIHGLYAAGVVTSGWQSYNYCIELSGSAVGFSLSSGRIAGENAAGNNRSS